MRTLHSPIICLVQFRYNVIESTFPSSFPFSFTSILPPSHTSSLSSFYHPSFVYLFYPSIIFHDFRTSSNNRPYSFPSIRPFCHSIFHPSFLPHSIYLHSIFTSSLRTFLPFSFFFLPSLHPNSIALIFPVTSFLPPFQSVHSFSHIPIHFLPSPCLPVGCMALLCL